MGQKGENLINVIICTLGTRIDDLKKNLISIQKQNCSTEVILVTQGNHELVGNMISDINVKIIHVKNYKKGLSLARNEALKYVTGDVLLFGDDDNWYKEDIFEYIESNLITNKIDVCCFKYFDHLKDIFPKQYMSSRVNNMSYFQLLRVSSIEIAINLRKVKKSDLHFDENFGLGTSNPSGEENLLLTYLKKQSYKISYLPEIISYHPAKLRLANESIYNEKYFKTKRKLFKKMYGQWVGEFINFAFYLKKNISKLFR